MLPKHRRFEVMDGLRGIAAMAVVLRHSFGGDGLFPNADLAVDFFFILSGFVIALSYGERLATTMSLREFMVRRLIRLYPMLLLGALGGLAIGAIHNFTNPADAYAPQALLMSGALSLFVLPFLWQGQINENVFSFNPPIWSLFFELFANFIYATTQRYLRSTLLIAVVVASLVLVIVFGSGGNLKTTFLLGFPRVFAGFFTGVLIYRLWAADVLPKIRGNFVVLAIVLSAIFMVPYEADGAMYAVMFLLLTLVVAAAATAEVQSGYSRIMSFLGATSYPLYLLHWLTLYLATFVGRILGFGDYFDVTMTVHLIATPFLAYAVLRFYDEPARKWLRDNLLGPPRRTRLYDQGEDLGAIRPQILDSH